MTGLLTFDTTHHALYAEQVALDAGLGVQVTPAPADARAGCDLALEYFLEDRDRLLSLLDGADIPHRIYSPARDARG